MAAAFVPSPPKDDFSQYMNTQPDDGTLGYVKEGLDSSVAGGEFPASRGQFESFGGDGFLDSSGYPYFSTNQTPVKQTAAQRVPETPALRLAFRDTPQTDDCRLNFSFDTPSVPGGRGSIGLRSVNEIPERYRNVFKNFLYFNYVQSKVFDDVMYTDSPLVASAPTGSGKTVIFELAIIRLLMQNGEQMACSKVVYVAPIKALCSERYEDWRSKFGPLGLRCCELTGDSQLDDYFELQNANIVMTTPEKWDSMTRKWRDYKSLVQLVRLFLIDEVHQLNDETRGPTMEAIVSRMKTIRSSLSWSEGSEGCKLRFIAISATMPNISDVAAWLGSSEDAPALEYSIDESHRPVRLRRVVLGYPDANSEFKFDFSLNYRLSGVIQCYSDQKPTLVFCATRKGTQQAANILIKDARFMMNSQHRQRLHSTASSVKDAKLRDLVVFGVGYHHAGMDVNDRKMIETLFTAGELPVLFATSTLAMGVSHYIAKQVVNLPAHLVVIKSTMHYFGGSFQECSESQILQMIGRAGRPQYDTTATAVIMTRNSTKVKYETLLSGEQFIESNLHRNLIEHLNAEIVLNTITDVSIALEWLRSTFFYVRVKQNPKHYGMPQEHEQMEEKLQQLCLQNLNLLEANSLVKMDDGFVLQPSETGRLMARYCVAFESMKRFLSLKGSEALADLVRELSLCREFVDVRLRVSEKRVLNSLNRDKNKPSIRYPMSGKIKSTDMKVNCLIQATLGCLPVQEFALNQDSQKIFRAASRLSKCLMELQMIGNCFSLLLNAVLLHKCIQARLWENSKYVSKQLDKIGLMLSTTLVNAGLNSFNKIQSARPRELELIMNRHPPFGNQISEAVSKVPNYTVTVEQSTAPKAQHSDLTISIHLTNHSLLKEIGSTFGASHASLLLVGDADDRVLCKQRISDSQLMGCGRFSRKLSLQRARAGDEVRVHFVSLEKVGTDVGEVFTPRYTTPPISDAIAIGRKTQQGGRVSLSESNDMSSHLSKPSSRPSRDSVQATSRRKACNHRYINKEVCGHECCKVGVVERRDRPVQHSKPAKTTGMAGGRYCSMSKEMEQHVNDIHAKAGTCATPSLRNIKPSLNISVNSTPFGRSRDGINRFSYTPRVSMTPRPAIDYGTKVSSFSHSSANYGNVIGVRSPSSNVEPRRVDRSLQPRSLALDLKSGRPSLDSTHSSRALRPSPLSPKDQNLCIYDFSDGFEDDFEQFEDDVSCTAVFKAGDENTGLMFVDQTETEAKSSPPANRAAGESGWRIPYSNRKRIIDEIFNDCGESVTAPLPKKMSSSAKSVSTEHQSERQVRGSNSLVDRIVSKRSRDFDIAYGDLPSLSVCEDDSKFHSVGDREPSLAHKLALKRESSESVRATTLQTSPEEEQVAMPSVWKSDSSAASCLQPPLDNPITYSFFTAGPTSPEEEEDGDVFGSVFAGIF